MIVLALDLAVIGVVAFCGWRGFKNGLIRGVFGVVALILSLFVATVAARAYSNEFREMLSPFIGGIIDSALVELAEEETEPDIEEVEGESENYIAAYSALRRIGLPKASAARVAELTTQGRDDEVIPTSQLSDMITEKLSSVLAFAAVFGIAFILLAIVFAVVGNLVRFVFSLPGLKLLDTISGAAFGAAKGLIVVYVLAAVARYVGVFAPEILEGTTILRFFVVNNPIANAIGI